MSHLNFHFDKSCKMRLFWVILKVRFLLAPLELPNDTFWVIFKHFKSTSLCEVSFCWKFYAFFWQVLVSYYEARRGKMFYFENMMQLSGFLWRNLFFGFSRTLWWLLKRKRWPSRWQPWEPWKNDALPTSRGPRLFPAFSPWNLAFGE